MARKTKRRSIEALRGLIIFLYITIGELNIFRIYLRNVLGLAVTNKSIDQHYILSLIT